MTCKTVTIEKTKMIICSRGHRPIRCKCGKPGNLLCDYPITGGEQGRTCDKGICETHTTKIGDLDYCPVHAKMAAAEK